MRAGSRLCHPEPGAARRGTPRTRIRSLKPAVSPPHRSGVSISDGTCCGATARPRAGKGLFLLILFMCVTSPCKMYDTHLDWLRENVIALVALGTSIVALWQSIRSARLSASLTRSKALSEIRDKMLPGRQAMCTIWERWPDRTGAPSTLTKTDREQFQDYYNATFHNAPSDSAPRALSDEINRLMHELDRVADRLARGEFTQAEVMRIFGHALAMDQHLIRIYLEAHWRDHEEHEKPRESRFWGSVPTIVNDAVSWKANSEKNT